MEQIDYIEKNKFWIARDRNGNLFMYGDKPIQKGNFFHPDLDNIELYHELNPSLFPEVTFENSPQQFQLTPVDH